MHRSNRQTAGVNPERVFVRAPNWVGDFVMATGAMERLRAAWPDAHITIAARPHLLPLLSGSNWCDATLPTPKAGGVKGLWDQVRAVRAGRFDLAVVMPNSPETGLVPLLARVPRRLGYRQGRPGMMNLGLRAQRNRRLFRRHGPRRVPIPMPSYYAQLLDVLGIPAGRDGTVLHVSDTERAEIDTWLRNRGIGPDSGRIVLLTAGAAYGVSKLWVADKWVEVARTLVARGDVPIFLAGPTEVELAEGLAERAGCQAATRPVISLAQLKALVDRSSAMITTDTGPRHLSVALDKPTVCLIGPNDPRYTNYSLHRTALIRKDIPCSPCQRKICPLGHQDCMQTITVEETLGELDRLLGTASHEAGADAAGGA